MVSARGDATRAPSEPASRAAAYSSANLTNPTLLSRPAPSNPSNSTLKPTWRTLACRNPLVNRRHHSPPASTAGPHSAPFSMIRPRPPRPGHSDREVVTEATNSARLDTTSAPVRIAGREANGAATTTGRARRRRGAACGRRASVPPTTARTHSGQWKPTEATIWQSEQMKRSQRWQRTPAGRAECL